ncbi:PREDICTED: U3 small nucleolar RNA-associated protein 25-like [Erythranthe guttata]|uniref:U3 small nucleolar RNA-associated protein 25-like n=1 Tax=Erythranthe guttata TaxID=4155 RepID=UPI00064DF170|nr:PREDICTED: U3 small nucleolar RNA-associated protein 25-like [Erythranthe guttata]|eukprot:XP_012850846.1 PREDICTED: U3 small nucleolar RNA-associated protein 25-like [Erythranthe guttata]
MDGYVLLDLNATGSQRRRGGNSPSRGGRGGRRGGRGGRTLVRPNPPRGLHLVDEETDDEAGDPTFAEPEAQALSSGSTESCSNDSTPPASTQGETLKPNMAAASSQHPVSEDVAAHVPENGAAPTVSDNAPQSAAEDAAPYQDQEMPDFSGMSSAEHVDIPTVDAQDFTTTEKTPSAPHEDPLETLAEAAVQVDALPSQVEEEEKSDDSWEVPLASFRNNLPSSESDNNSFDSSQMEEDAAPPVASPEPAYIPDELEDSEEEEPSEDEDGDLDGKDLSTPFEITYHQSMVEMLQKALSNQKGGEQASHEVEAGTSHPLDDRGREHGVNEEEENNEGEAEGAEESSESSASDGGTTADIEDTLDILL